MAQVGHGGTHEFHDAGPRSAVYDHGAELRRRARDTPAEELTKTRLDGGIEVGGAAGDDDDRTRRTQIESLDQVCDVVSTGLIDDLGGAVVLHGGCRRIHENTSHRRSGRIGSTNGPDRECGRPREPGTPGTSARHPRTPASWGRKRGLATAIARELQGILHPACARSQGMTVDDILPGDRNRVKFVCLPCLLTMTRERVRNIPPVLGHGGPRRPGHRDRLRRARSPPGRHPLCAPPRRHHLRSSTVSVARSWRRAAGTWCAAPRG